MNLEIHKPELVERVYARLQTGQFRDADDVIEKALDTLDERTTAIPARDTRTGADLIAALQTSPYRELEIEPSRVRLANVRDVARSLDSPPPVQQPAAATVDAHVFDHHS